MGQKCMASRQIGYCGQELDAGQVTALAGVPGDEKLLALGYLVSVPEGEETALCHVCGAEFGRDGGWLGRHQRSRHNGEEGAAQPVSMKEAEASVESATKAAQEARGAAIQASLSLRDLEYAHQAGVIAGTDRELLHARQNAPAALRRSQEAQAALARAEATLRTADLVSQREREEARRGGLEEQVRKTHPEVLEELEEAQRAYSEALAAPPIEGAPTATRIAAVEGSRSRLTAARAAYERACFEAEA